MDRNSELFDRFFDGKAPPEDEVALLHMINDGELGPFDEYCRGKWESSAGDISQQLRLRIKSQLLKKIACRDCGAHMSWTPRLKRIVYTTAAAVMLLFALQMGWYIAQHRAIDVIETITEAGQKSNIILPDGSRVWLNSASRVSYNSDFNVKNRNISLQGEAYFEVAEGHGHPFVVKAQDISVTAIGTKFNIRAYNGDNTVTTTLVEGKVMTEASSQTLMLNPNQEAVYDKVSGIISKSDLKDDAYAVPWMQNSILFQDHSLEEIAAILERMYNVNIVFDDDTVRKYSFTGLIRNNSLSNILELISGTSPVNYTMTTDTIRFFVD